MLFRLCELLIDSSFDPTSHVPRSAPVKHGIAANGCSFISFHLLCTKTKDKGDDVSLTDTGCNCSPVAVFDHHIASNSMVPDDAPLFAFKSHKGEWSLMQREWFLARCNQIWALDGLSLVKGPVSESEGLLTS